MIEFFIHGVPVPQGSKRAFQNRHTGRVQLVEVGGDRLTAWRHAVRFEALRAYGDAAPATGAVELVLEFFMTRPKNHSNKRGLKPTAPRVPITRPDIDKSSRAVLDSLTGVLYRDDSQVTRLTAAKYYGEHPGLRVVATEGL